MLPRAPCAFVIRRIVSAQCRLRLEPLEFKNLFPFWSVNETAKSCNLNDGKTEGQKDCICAVLAQLNRNCYPLSVLKQRPLPDGVNPMKLEFYLSDQEFEVMKIDWIWVLIFCFNLNIYNFFKELLHVTKESFFSLPNWKQVNMKKKAYLF